MSSWLSRSQRKNTHDEDADHYLREIDGEYILDDSGLIYTPKSFSAKKEKPKETQHWWPPFIVSIFTMLLLICTVYYTRNQWLAADASARHALDTLDQIKEQTRLMRQETVATFGAVVPAEFPRPSPIADDLELLKYQGINLFFANIGKAPATDFVANATIYRKRLPTFGVIGSPQHRQIRVNRIRPYDQMPPGIPGVYSDDAHLTFDTRDFTAKDLALISTMEETIEVSGYAEFSNGFGESIHQPFCFLYTVPRRYTFMQSGSSTGGGVGQWGLCDDVKRLIITSKDWPQ